MNKPFFPEALEGLTATDLQNTLTEAQGLAARVRNLNLGKTERTAALQRLREIESETGLDLFESYNRKEVA